MMMISWARKSAFKTVAKTQDNENIKKGLFIFSRLERFYTTFSDYVEKKLKSMVVSKENNFILMSQIDSIECELLDNCENILNNYDILFITQKVSLSEKIFTKLKSAIELGQIAIVFMNAQEIELIYQLNYLKKSGNKVFCNENSDYQLNKSAFFKLANFKSKSSAALQQFYAKHCKVVNDNYNNDNETDEYINIDLENKRLTRIYPKDIIDLDDWHVLLKNKEKYSILLHKKYKILISHWTGRRTFDTKLSSDLFDYLVKYLLFEYESEEKSINLFKKNLLFNCGNDKLIDLIILCSNYSLQ